MPAAAAARRLANLVGGGPVARAYATPSTAAAAAVDFRHSVGP